MKSPEIEPKIGEIRRESKPGEGGYSEKEQALDIESRSGDLSGQKRSRIVNQKEHAKALEEYKIISKELGSLLESYVMLIEKDLHQASKILDNIEKIRVQQKEILDRLFGK